MCVPKPGNETDTIRRDPDKTEVSERVSVLDEEVFDEIAKGVILLNHWQMYWDNDALQ